MNKIKMSAPNVSLINNIGAPNNYPSKHTLEITDSGADIHLYKQSTTIMAPFIISNGTKARLSNGTSIQSL